MQKLRVSRSRCIITESVLRAGAGVEVAEGRGSRAEPGGGGAAPPGPAPGPTEQPALSTPAAPGGLTRLGLSEPGANVAMAPRPLGLGWRVPDWRQLLLLEHSML